MIKSLLILAIGLLLVSQCTAQAVKAGLRDYLRAQPETAEGEFDLPMVTRVQRCVRSGG